MNEENKLTEEEEQLLREFEQERQKQKLQVEREVHQELKEDLAEQVKDVMEKEIAGGIEAEVRKEVEMEMDIEVEKAINVEEMKKKLEEEIRKKIEQETREKLQKEIEEKIRKEVEEREKQRKSELIKKIQALSLYEEELRKQRESEIKETEKSINESLQKQQEELKNKLKEELKKELEEERRKKKEALLQRLDSSIQVSSSPSDKILNHNEKIIILQLFEESQLVLSTLLTARLNKKDVESIFYRTLTIVANNYPEILKRSMYDKNGNQLPGGILNTSRVIANVELMNVTENKSSEESIVAEEKATSKFLEALKAIFIERLITVEKLTNSDIKNKLYSDVMNQMKKSIMKKGYGTKISNMFFNNVFPDIKSI
jgi:hypothetical protein